MAARDAPPVMASAIFDSTGMYRYWLGREWDRSERRLVFVMLNPSTADAIRNDPTIRRCIGFARSWGFGAVEAVNLFAYRATRPPALREAADPVGPENDRHLLEACGRADSIVLAWGNHGSFQDRADEAIRLLAGCPVLYCLGETKSGHPRHPLHSRGDLVPKQWRRR